MKFRRFSCFGLAVLLSSVLLSGCASSRPALTRGINLGNSLEAPKGEDWGLEIKDEYFDAIKKAGFDHVRLPVRFSDYFDGDNLDEEFMAKIDEHINYAIKSAKLSVILDFHHYDELYTDLENHEQDFYKIWEILSERYKKHSGKLAFEILNEPRGQVTDEKWNEMLNKTIGIIRKTNKNREIIVDSGFWASAEHIGALDLPEDEFITVAIHYYTPQPFTFQGDPYNGYAGQSGVKWGDENDKQVLKNTFKKVKTWAEEKNIKVIVNEFGAAKTVPEDMRLDWIGSVRGEAQTNGFGWTYWEFGTGFGIYDTNANTWDTLLLDALTKDIYLK